MKEVDIITVHRFGSELLVELIGVAHVKHVVGELKNGSNDFFKSFSTRFA